MTFLGVLCLDKFDKIYLRKFIGKFSSLTTLYMYIIHSGYFCSSSVLLCSQSSVPYFFFFINVFAIFMMFLPCVPQSLGLDVYLGFETIH